MALNKTQDAIEFDQDQDQAAARADQLRREIEHHRFQYYVLEKPEITDASFDVLYNELLALEERFPALVTPSSPTRKVGAPPSTEFRQIQHRIPMLSLSNAMGDADLDKWHDRIARSLEFTAEQASTLRYVCELKIDGLSIALTYKNGRFEEGATRGNGDVGEDVSLNLKTIGALPTTLRAEQDLPVPELLELRGEVYMPVTSFNEANQELLENGQPPYANPRNAASGSLRQKNPKVTAQRKLALWTYFAYITDPKLGEPRTHSETLALMERWGLPVNPHRAVVEGIDGVKAFCAKWDEPRHGLDYQTDGVVIKVDDRSLWSLLGATSHSPRWAIAFKYPPDERETIVESIEYEVGRTGAVTPCAYLQPVQLAGTTVKRATLHNFEQIRRLDVRAGDTVVVRKAGEIIPEVLRVVPERRPANSQPVVEPTNCPACQSKLERQGAEVVLRCLNSACPAQVQRRLEHWVSRSAMDIEGLGEVLIFALLRSGLVSDPSQLYELTVDSLADVELDKPTDGRKARRIGKVTAEKIIAGLEKSKTRPLGNLIFALGVRHVGSSTGELLADHFGDMTAIMSATAEQLETIEGVGPSLAEGIIDFFANRVNRALVEKLAALGLNMRNDAEPREKLAPTLAGKTFVITGTLETMDRTDAEKQIKARGGKASSSVSKKTDYLVVGANPGSKLAKAQELGITVIEEAQFRSLLGE
ncbi:MAG: NAD-dependent DNA ligase LigA [Candidatus Obscuribacterales bacterium]